MTKSHLLIDESPLQVLPSLAVAIGLEEAIILQQLHYWLSNQKNAGRVDQDGNKWVFNTYEEWQADNFPFWNTTKIQRLFLSLEKSGVVISTQLDAKKHDMRKFYRIDYDKLCTMDDSFLLPSKDAKMNHVNRNTETTPETTTEKFTPSGVPPVKNTSHQTMMGVLAKITGFDLKMHGGRLGRSASKLVKAGYLPELLEMNYAPGGWWYKMDWRGLKDEMPTPEQIVETIGRIEIHPKVNGQNGHAPQIKQMIILPDGQIVEA